MAPHMDMKESKGKCLGKKMKGLSGYQKSLKKCLTDD